MKDARKKYSNEYVEEYLSEYKLKLITKNYKGVTQKIEIKCSCGNTFSMQFNKLQKYKYKCCKECRKLSMRTESFKEFKKYVNENTDLKIISSLNEFSTRKEKLEFECSCGEVFRCSPNQMMKYKKHICNKCTLDKTSQRLRLNIKDVIETINSDESGCKYVDGEYINNTSELTIMCFCGNKFITTLAQFTHQDKKQCNDCGNKNKGQYKKISYSEVKSYIETKDMKLITTEHEYVNAKTPIKIECTCGEYFENTFSQFKYGKGIKCNRCNRKDISERHAIPYSEIKEYVEIESDSGCKLISKEDSYKNTRTNITFKCKCGDEFVASFHEFKSGNKRQCNTCGNNLMKISEFLKLFESQDKINNCKLINYTESNGYVLTDSVVELECNCGQVFSVTRYAFTHHSSNRCKTCTGAKSKGELRVENHLKYLGMDSKWQYSFEDCRGKQRPLPFDFAVFDNNGKLLMLIEYDGKQHFEPIEYFGGEENFKIIKMRDEIKNTYCKKNNIPLLRIPYWEFDNIEEILHSELQKYNLIHN